MYFKAYMFYNVSCKIINLQEWTCKIALIYTCQQQITILLKSSLNAPRDYLNFIVTSLTVVWAKLSQMINAEVLKLFYQIVSICNQILFFFLINLFSNRLQFGFWQEIVLQTSMHLNAVYFVLNFMFSKFISYLYVI